MKIKTNDKVKVLSGKDRGKTGKVIQVFPIERKVVVEGLNIIKRHVRARKQGEKGQRLELAGPMAMSKVMLLCPRCSKAARVGFKMEAKEKKRLCRQCKEIIE